MAKKKSKADIERRKKSAAAKRGWATRRRNQKAIKKKAKSTTKSRNIASKKHKANKDVETAIKSGKKYKKAVQKANLAIEKVREFDADFVPDAMPGFLRLNDTIAFHFSRIRTMPVEVQLYVRQLLVDAEISGNLELEIIEIAKRLQITTREVWTFWFSP